MSHTPPSPAAPAPGRGACLVLLGALCFSTSGTAQALAPEGATPYVIGALRMQVAFLALLVWCLLRKRLPQQLHHWPLRWLLPAAGGLVLFQLCFFRRVQLTGVAVGTVASIGFSPLAAAVLAWLLLGERPGPRWYAATLLSLAGLCCLSGADGTVPWTSLLLPLAAGTGYALYFVCTRPLGRQYAPDSIMLVLTGLSGLALLPVLPASPLYWLVSPAGTATALYLGTVTAALAFSLTTAGLRLTRAATAATLALAEPLAAACWGIFLLHERLSAVQLAGLGLLVAGMAILATERPPHALPAAGQIIPPGPPAARAQDTPPEEDRTRNPADNDA